MGGGFAPGGSAGRPGSSLHQQEMGSPRLSLSVRSTNAFCCSADLQGTLCRAEKVNLPSGPMQGVRLCGGLAGLPWSAPLRPGSPLTVGPFLLRHGQVWGATHSRVFTRRAQNPRRDEARGLDLRLPREGATGCDEGEWRPPTPTPAPRMAWAMSEHLLSSGKAAGLPGPRSPRQGECFPEDQQGEDEGTPWGAAVPASSTPGPAAASAAGGPVLPCGSAGGLPSSRSRD